MNKEIICNNCGNTGHQANDCKMPIISLGIITIRINPKTKQKEFLMICRRDSFGYSDFMYTKSCMYNDVYMLDIINEMTLSEKERIQQCLDVMKLQEKSTNNEVSKSSNHNSINNNIHLIDSAIYRKVQSYENYIKLHNLSFSLETLLQKTTTAWSECEWGFPKGRRNLHEKDLSCALREFEEETGYKRQFITIVENLSPFEEIYIGSNNKCYKHKYFIAFMDYENTLNTNDFQISEVSNLQWKTYNECIQCMRPYNVEKKVVLRNVKKCLDSHKII